MGVINQLAGYSLLIAPIFMVHGHGAFFGDSHSPADCYQMVTKSLGKSLLSMAMMGNLQNWVIKMG